jgi:CHAT domain-containing protein
MSFAIAWHAGPTAQLEFFDPADASGGSAGESFRIRFTPPFRSTLRVPVEPFSFGGGQLASIRTDLDASVGAGGQRSGGTAVTVSTPNPADLVRTGKQLYKCAVPPHLRIELRRAGLFLEIGVDEKLVGFPWELMHDGDDFLCKKHRIGRYVNVHARPQTSMVENYAATGEVDDLSVLLISVPRPQPRKAGETFEELKHAKAETKALTDALVAMPGVTLNVLKDRDATYNNVFDALESRRYHIVHYTGHAHFDRSEPSRSALVLDDRDLDAGSVRNFLSSSPPVVCFMNACETGAAPVWKDSYDIYGLAWAFLETGSYLLGSCWKVDDEVAKTFAGAFYDSLLVKGHTIGTSVTEARKAAYREDDFGWASYVLYGDPRLAFTPQATD